MTTMRKLAVLVVSCLALAKAQVPSFGWCPDHLPKADFDMEKYLGTWYEAERYVSLVEAGSRCVRTEYTKAKDNRILVANEIQNRLTGITRILNGEIRFLQKGAESKLNVKYSTLPYPVETSYTILDSDYDSYAVVWSCSGLGLFNTQNAWVMTRDQNPSVTTLQKAYAVLDKFKIGRTFFVKTDQTDCKIAETANNNDVDKEDEVAEGGEKSAGVVVADPKPVEAPADVAVRKEQVADDTKTEKEQPANEVQKP